MTAIVTGEGLDPNVEDREVLGWPGSCVGVADSNAAEGRTPHDRDDATEGAVEEIAAVNKRRKAGGWYLGEGELREALEEVWGRAAREVHGGKYTDSERAGLVAKPAILAEAMPLILGSPGGKSCGKGDWTGRDASPGTPSDNTGVVGPL